MSTAIRKCYGSKRRALATPNEQRAKSSFASAIQSLVEDHYVPEKDWTWGDAVNPVVCCSGPPPLPPSGPSSLPSSLSPASSPDAAIPSPEADLSDGSTEEKRSSSEACVSAPVRPFARCVSKPILPPKPYESKPILPPKPKAMTKEEKDLAAMSRRRKARVRSKSSKQSKQTEQLLQVAEEWEAWDRSSRGDLPKKQKSKTVNSDTNKENHDSSNAVKPKRKRTLCEVTLVSKVAKALELGADCNAHGAAGTCAMLALSSIDSQAAHTALRACLEHSGDANVTHLFSGKGPLDIALESGNAWAVRALIRRGGQPQQKPSSAEGCSTLVEFGALRGFVKEAALCVAGAVFNAVDDDNGGWLSSLLCHGVKPDIHDAAGRTPLHMCVEDGKSIALVQALLLKGANPNARDKLGVPIAVFALLRQDREAFALLAQHGLDPLVKSTPLCYLYTRDVKEPGSEETIWDMALSHGWRRADLDSMFNPFA